MATLRVSNQSQLDAAVRTANGGDTILLGSGSYARLEMNGINEGGKVTVTSANPGAPAVIKSMLLKNSSNVEVKNVDLQSSGGTPFVVESSRTVKLDNVDIDGRPGGYGTGIGLRVKGSQDVALTNSEVSHFSNGLSFSGNSNIRISNNDFRSMSVDAMQLGGINGGVIDGNDFRQMHSPDATRHKDMIQFVTGNGNAPSSNITIRNNVIDNGEVSHAIFFGNAMAKAGNLGAFYKNILIEDNYIRSAHVHGATVEHGSGVRILDNTLVANGDEGNRRDINIPLINVSKSSVNVTIQGNKVASVPDAQGSWNISGNVTGSRDLDHWHGSGVTLRASSGGTASSLAAQEAPSTALGAEAEVGGGSVFQVSGRQRRDADVSIEDFSFADGDTIVFRNFDEGALAGGSAAVDSLQDLRELVDMSSAVSAKTRGDLLILEIAQGRDVDEVRIEGLGQEFRAEPELF